MFHQTAENQSGEVEESKAPQTLKVDVQDTDGVRIVISHTISLVPSLWRILDNLLVKRTAEPKIFCFIAWRKSKVVKLKRVEHPSLRRLMSRILMSRGQLNSNLLLRHMAENQSGEVEQSRASQSVEVDVQDTDGVRKSNAFHIKDPRQSSSQEDRHGKLIPRTLWCEEGYISNNKYYAFHMKDPRQSSSQQKRHGRLKSRIMMV
ncbi:unnamed protein product [Mytilus coruscus]|uniref:Uncharacterized protein n=1 Tax=Mytilus coruscus TaxID=42192 RepID=A0A6J8C3S1_MYTCO|nr:unnamed protein product [Mytilus coruscus]